MGSDRGHPRQLFGHKYEAHPPGSTASYVVPL